jgi:hypothetical protein
MKGKFDLAAWAERQLKKDKTGGCAIISLVEAMCRKNDAGCWIWRGHTNERGYASWKPANHSMESVYRAIANAAHGPKPPGMLTRHLCHEKLCVNPEHLRYGTHHENMLDMQANGSIRSLFGPREVDDCRRLYRSGATLISLQEKYDCSAQAMCHVLFSRTGKHGRTSRYKGSTEPTCDRNGTNANRHLDDQQVAYIILRVQEGESYAQIARDTGTQRGTVRQIALNRTYRHVPRTDRTIQDSASDE